MKALAEGRLLPALGQLASSGAVRSVGQCKSNLSGGKSTKTVGLVDDWKEPSGIVSAVCACGVPVMVIPMLGHETVTQHIAVVAGVLFATAKHLGRLPAPRLQEKLEKCVSVSADIACRIRASRLLKPGSTVI